jgi:MarR family 2-MHQ and catechol resistance regulon transcriptional repressor
MKHNHLPEKQRLALNSFVKLMRASNQLSVRAHRHLQEDNLTHSQFAVLEALYHLGPLCQSDLGLKILKSNANLTTVVDSLEKKALVIRDRPTTDRRRVMVVLTAAGEKLVARIFPRHAEVIEREFSVLSNEEQHQLVKLLKKLGTCVNF